MDIKVIYFFNKKYLVNDKGKIIFKKNEDVITKNPSIRNTFKDVFKMFSDDL